jgi:hypothetical protein
VAEISDNKQFIYSSLHDTRNLENNNTCSETKRENKSEKLSFLTIKTLKFWSSSRRRPALRSRAVRGGLRGLVSVAKGGSVVTVVCLFVCVFSRG